MEDTKKTPAELVADLMLDPGFVLVPQDRYEELIRAETERMCWKRPSRVRTATMSKEFSTPFSRRAVRCTV